MDRPSSIGKHPGKRPEGSSGQPTEAASLIVEYYLGSPVSMLVSKTQDGSNENFATYHETYAYVDGLGRTLVTLTEADPTEDGHGWIAEGLTDYDAKGCAGPSTFGGQK